MRSNAKPGTDDADLQTVLRCSWLEKNLYGRNQRFFLKGDQFASKATSIPLQRAVKRSRQSRYLRQMSICRWLQVTYTGRNRVFDKLHFIRCNVCEINTALKIKLFSSSQRCSEQTRIWSQNHNNLHGAEVYHGAWTLANSSCIAWSVANGGSASVVQ